MARIMRRRSDSIADMMPEALRQSRYYMKRCFQRYVSRGSRLMKQQHLLEELHAGGSDSFLGHVISCTHEAVVLPPYVALAVRRNPGVWEYITVHSGDLTVQQITPSDYLRRKESLYDHHWAQDDSSLEVNLGALDFSTPRLTLPSSIGNGMHLVSRFLSSRLGGVKKPLLDYLLALRHQNTKLLISDTLDTVGKLQAALLLAQGFVSEQHPDTPFQQMAHRFQEWGLEKGWGDTAGACGHTLGFLSEMLQAPDPVSVDRFFSRVPSVFDVVIFSVHGYFGQHKVLGMPDTGGQVVYIQKQRAPPATWSWNPLRRQGTPASSVCHSRPKMARICPTGSPASTFTLTFACLAWHQDSCAKILDILGRKPDLVIGNYTDGNLVAYLVSRKLGVTQRDADKDSEVRAYHAAVGPALPASHLSDAA